MNSYRADLHCHVGGLGSGAPVKISADKNMTISAVLQAAVRESLDMVGVVDCHLPGVAAELRQLIDMGELESCPGGGYRWQDRTTLICGTETEVIVCGRPVHVVILYPALSDGRLVLELLTESGSRASISTQRLRNMSIGELSAWCRQRSYLVYAAHVFTPYRGLLGAAVSKLSEAGLVPGDLDAVELGLSADGALAARLPDLAGITWLSNSDAHSVRVVGREFNLMSLQEPNFTELALAMRRSRGRRVEKNYGLPPALGKYYRSACGRCRTLDSPGSDGGCLQCGSRLRITGVARRVDSIGGPPTDPDQRYNHVIPLTMVPGIGPTRTKRLLSAFGSGYRVVYEVPLTDIKEIAGRVAARGIGLIRSGKFEVVSGGGGRSGSVVPSGITTGYPSYP